MPAWTPLDPPFVRGEESGTTFLETTLEYFPFLCAEPRASARADSRTPERIGRLRSRNTITDFALEYRETLIQTRPADNAEAGR